MEHHHKLIIIVKVAFMIGTVLAGPAISHHGNNHSPVSPHININRPIARPITGTSK